jgi:hypothetical protein
MAPIYSQYLQYLRLFSGTKINFTNRRNELGLTSKDAHMCLKRWYKVLNGKVVPDFEGVVTEQPPTIAEALADFELQFPVICSTRMSVL